jgi:hypothetical protein
MALIWKDICYYSNCLLVLSNWLVIILRRLLWVLLLPKSSHKKLSVILYVLCTICIQYLLLWVVVCSHDPYLFLLLYLRLRYGFTFSLSYSFHLTYMLFSNYMRNRFFNIFFVTFITSIYLYTCTEFFIFIVESCVASLLLCTVQCCLFPIYYSM